MSSPILLQRRFFWSSVAFCALCLLSLILLMINNGHKAIITITPAQSDIASDWNISVVNPSIATSTANPNIIAGQTLIAQARSTVPVASNPDLKSRGSITIINENTREQTLIPTTRFLSANGVLFRLTQQVIIPAKGKVTGEIVADAPGAAGDVGPGRFTIPGLSSALQTKIYGQTDKAMTGGSQNMTMSDLIIPDGVDWKVAASDYFKDKISSPYSLAPDTLTKTESAGQITISGVAYDLGAVKQEAAKILTSKLPIGYQIKTETLNSKVKSVNFDSTNKTANVIFTISAQTTFDPQALDFDWLRLLGQPVSTAKAYLASVSGVKEVEITMQPNWRQSLPAAKKQIIFKSAE